MSNTINTRTEQVLELLDLVYKKGALTAAMDYTGPLIAAGANAKTIQIAKRSLSGLGDYGRKNGGAGFPAGNVAQTWESHTFSIDRGIEFEVDALDNDETGMTAFGSIGSFAGQVIKEKAAPEIDAYRFAKIAGTANIQTTTGATLSASTVKAAIDTAIEKLDDAEVPEEGRTLYVSNSVFNFLKNASGFTYNLQADPTTGRVDTRVAEYEGMPIVKVPQSRFYTAIDLYDGVSTGETAGGYAKAAAGKDINFLIVHKDAIAGIQKSAKLRYFTPDQNQGSDSHKFQYRLYHDLFVFENKVNGIYLHKKA